MAYAGQQFQYEAMLMEERLDHPLICGCCFSNGICCDFHRSIYPDLPSQPSTTQLKPSFDDDKAWTTNDSGSFLDSYQYSSSSSVHGFGQASTDATSASEESSSSSSEDEKFLHRSKPCCKDSIHEQQYPSSLRSLGPVSQHCNESFWVESLPIDEAHNQFISPAMLTLADKTASDHEAKPKKRQRTQEEPGMVQRHRNTDADIQSTKPTRINLLDPQILLKPQSSERQVILHQLLGIYAEFTSPLNPQSLQAFEGLAALLKRLVKDWIKKPTHLQCLKDRDGIPITPAARDPNEPYACVCGCGYRSPRLIDLERHLSQNWLASYWQCPLCDKHFDRRDMLSAHLRSKKHSGSGEKVNEERDFRRNGCDDEFTKQCGFCGEVCKGFKVFTRHIGKHFRGTSSEPPKGMRDWRDTWDDDDSNGDDGKGGGRTGKPSNNGDHHDRGGGSNGGTSGSSKGGENDSSKGSTQSRDRGTKSSNSRSGRSSTCETGGSGFRASGSSSIDGSLSLSDSAVSFGVRHVREKRKAGGLPLRPKKTGKQPRRPHVAESIIDTVEAPILATQNAFSQVSGPPRRGPQSSEVIVDAAERWKAFRLKYDSSSLKTQAAKVWKPSQSRSPSEAPPQSCHHKNNSGSASAKVKASVPINKATNDLATGRSRSEEASQHVSILDAKRIIKQRKQSKRRLRDGEAVRLGASTRPLADIEPFGVSRIFGSSGKPCRPNDFELNWSDEDMSLPSVERKKNASMPPSQYEDTAYKMADNLSFKWNASSYRKQESKAQEHVPRHREVFEQPHRESSRREWPSAPPLHHVGKRSRKTFGDFLAGFSQSTAPVLSPGPHNTRRRGSTPPAQPDQLQPVQHPRSEDNGKLYSGDLECPPLDAPSGPDLMALSRQPAGITSGLSTLAHHFAGIDFGNYAACEKLVKQHPEILEDGQQPSGPKHPHDRHTTGRHRQQQSFLNIPPDLCFGFDNWGHWKDAEVEDFPPRSSSLDRGEQKAQGHGHEDENQRSLLGFVPYNDVPGSPMFSNSGFPSWTPWFAPINTYGGSGIAEPAFNLTDVQSVVGAYPAAPLTYVDWGAHPPDMIATQMPDMYRALRFAPLDDGLSASFACSLSDFACKDYRSISSQEMTSVSKLKQHFFRAHSRPNYTCHRCFKMFRTRSKWLGHAERRFCSVDNSGSQAQMTKDQKKRSNGTAPNSQGIEQHWLAIYQLLFPTAAPPLSLYPDDPCGDSLSLISAANNVHGVPGLEDDGPSHIHGCEVRACQSNSPGTIHRPHLGIHVVILVPGSPGALVKVMLSVQNMRITEGAPVTDALDAVRQVTCKTIAKLWTKKIEPEHVLVLVTLNERQAESTKGTSPGASGVACRGGIYCFGTSEKGPGLVYIFMR